MATQLNFLFLLPLFLFILQFPSSFSGKTDSMTSVPDLQESMYIVVNGDPCVRLLNLTGEIGCANPGRDKVVAPVVRFRNADDLTRSSAVLVSLAELQEVFDRISKNPNFANNVGGVLVESGTDIKNKIKGFSPAQKFPEAEFAPYGNINYEWNANEIYLLFGSISSSLFTNTSPSGSGIMHKTYNFPVFLVSEGSIQYIQKAALKNEKTKNPYTANVAEFDMVMQTTKSGTRDSKSCLREGTCLPLGGYSVWSSLPPVNVSSSNQMKPVILTVATMDSASFFRDKSMGAESPISGLITLLAAVDSLSRLDGLSDLSKQLVFAVFTGEAWGYLGSRRFLLELDLQSDAVKGLNSTLIDMVLEIGSVGKGISGGNTTFFAHAAGVSSTTNEMLNALIRAQNSLKSKNILIKSSSTSNPGIPPSSLMAFLRKNSSTPGIVLEDFDSSFSNKFYHSYLDDISKINSSAIVAAASLVARTLYILASGDKTISSSSLSAISVNASLVEELMGCLLECEPGLSCELVKNYISPSTTCPSHYVGVVVGEPSSTPYLGYVSDVSRFLWNFLADRTSVPKETASFSCSQDCSNTGEVCIKAETNEKGVGVCVISTTRYVPAYSTRLKFEAGTGTWNVLPPNSSDTMEMVDPVWTESNWNGLGVRVYTVQNSTFDHLVLIGGIAITLFAYLATILASALITKSLKRD